MVSETVGTETVGVVLMMVAETVAGVPSADSADQRRDSGAVHWLTVAFGF